MPLDFTKNNIKTFWSKM